MSAGSLAEGPGTAGLILLSVDPQLLRDVIWSQSWPVRLSAWWLAPSTWAGAGGAGDGMGSSALLPPSV